MNGITLSLHPYCDYCPDFEPIVDKYDITSFGDKHQKIQSDIKCEYAERCAKIYERLREDKDE